MPAILSKNCVLVGEVESYCLVCCEPLPAEHDALAHIQQPSHKHSLTSHHYLHKFRRDCIRKVRCILSKNCVLVGEVESYCLVCCELLPAEHDALAHIQQPSHKHSLTSHHYLHKFRRDCIRKVAGVYFCEFCNVTFPTAAKVSLHVTEATHVERRRGRMLTRGDNYIVFNENVLITEHAWNGLVDDTCVLCNAEFDDESLHKSEQSHMLNLIRSRVTIGVNNDIYRQVEGFYQCLTCNKVVAAIDEHLDTAEHKSMLIADNQDNGTDIKSEKIQDAQCANKSTEKDSANDVQNDGVEGKSLYTEPVLEKNNQKQTSLKSIPQDVDSFAKQHGLSITKNSHKAYCSKCSAEVAATLHGIKKHVEGKKHTEKLTKRADINKQTPTKLTKMLVKKYIEVMSLVEVEVEEPNGKTVTIPYIYLNNSFLIHAHTFVGTIKYRDTIICHFCDIDLTPQTYEMHLHSAQHSNIVKNCFIITSLPREFIRQLKSDLFDCLYCGHVERNLEDMLDHIETDEHKRHKEAHDELLIKYKASLIERHIQNTMPFNLAALMNSMRQFN